MRPGRAVEQGVDLDLGLHVVGDGLDDQVSLGGGAVEGALGLDAGQGFLAGQTADLVQRQVDNLTGDVLEDGSVACPGGRSSDLPSLGPCPGHSDGSNGDHV